MQQYHYTESGLDNVWLASGFRFVPSPRGRSLIIEDIEGLHVAIGRSIVEEEKKLTGPEIRFLRTELLLSQNALSRLLGVTEQTVARWEKPKQAPIPTAADATLRQLYLEHVGAAWGRFAGNALPHRRHRARRFPNRFTPWSGNVGIGIWQRSRCRGVDQISQLRDTGFAEASSGWRREEIILTRAPIRRKVLISRRFREEAAPKQQKHCCGVKESMFGVLTGQIS